MVTLAFLIQLIGREPDMEGLATYYVAHHPDAVFRSGEPWAPDAPVCGVDASRWEELAGKTLFGMAARMGRWTWTGHGRTRTRARGQAGMDRDR